MTAGTGERSLALAAIILSTVVFAVAAPFARVPLAPLPAFIPAYEAALIINDLISSLLMFGQFVQCRSRAVLVLACGYLFEGLVVIPHALSFPGLASPGGLLGAGPQTTAWLYMFWHGGFPLFVMVYAVLAWRESLAPVQPCRRAGGGELAVGIAVAVVLAAGVTLLATAGEDLLPRIMDGHRYAPGMKSVHTTVWVLSLLALLALLWRRAPSVLDLWLRVVMCAWLFDVILSAVINGGRWDVGFYAGRAYGFMATSFVLWVLLLETSGLYCRLARAKVDLEGQAHKLESDMRTAVAEQRRTEGQLRQAQKMEAIGNLTGGIAHDFNNLLGVLIGNLDLVRERVENDAEALELVDAALDAGLRGAELNRRLLAFSRRQTLQPEEVDINAAISGMVTLLRRSLGERIDIRLACEDDVWRVKVDPAQFETTIVNLAVNARDAMPQGGRLMIETHNRTLDAVYAASHSELSPGDYVLVAVSDTGSGIAPDVLPRVFDPFFTTKQVGKGTGLGLSMVYGFMKQSGGHVNIYSEPGKGTTVRLYLPRFSSVPEERAAAAAVVPEIEKARHELVLVAEDNADMRRVAVRQLADLGYRVVEADSGDKALALIEGGLVPDILFTDVIMPGSLDGIDLADRACSLLPGLPVLLSSGFTERVILDTHERNGREVVYPLLAKPFRKDDLARALRRVLERPQAQEEEQSP
ncbi:MAG: MASE4 domain-containing protein [Alphaproteobacteria bacterium]|nr:MASE4 domain-containing protein [Alphaproteobacteria bacterium]